VRNEVKKGLIYGYKENDDRMANGILGWKDQGKSGKRAKYQGILSNGRDTQELIFLLAAKAA
jgi:hypothetical protein